MNKLYLAGRVWLASDIHLGPDTPATAQAFRAFLELARNEADALILCGDIFDAWIGDDFALRAPPPWLASTLDQFQQVAQSIPLWLGRGNRDFLIGRSLAHQVGAQLLPDIVCLQTDFGAVLLSHGDEYCTADVDYQRFRRVVRSPVVQRLFLALGLGFRRRIADWARQRSMAANQYKARDIMDVSGEAIEEAFRSTGLATMVHGHTHKPAVHELLVDNAVRTRIVLPDWDYDHATRPRGGWLTIDETGFSLQQAVKP